MKCPKCGSYQVTVIDSRRNDITVWRRRSCNDCFHRFNTQEVSVEEWEATKQNEKVLREIIDKLRKDCAARVRKEMLNENESCT